MIHLFLMIYIRDFRIVLCMRFLLPNPQILYQLLIWVHSHTWLSIYQSRNELTLQLVLKVHRLYSRLLRIPLRMNNHVRHRPYAHTSLIIIRWLDIWRCPAKNLKNHRLLQWRISQLMDYRITPGRLPELMWEWNCHHTDLLFLFHRWLKSQL